MGYAPQFNFRLRDDEVVFGNLIIGKEIVQDIEKLLIAIRNGAQINLEPYKQLFGSYIFTDDEFSAVKDDYEQIKIDYAFFRDMMNAKLRFDFSASLNHMNTIVNYAMGSTTWLEKYAEMKNMAGEMYRKLKSIGVNFEEREAEYEQRYAEIKLAESNNGAIVTSLVEQYKLDVMHGAPDAEERFLKTMSALGPVEQAKAENWIKLQRASSIVGKEQVVAKAGTRSEIESEFVEGYEDRLPKSKETEEKVLITAKMLRDRIADISQLNDMTHIVAGFVTLNKYVEGLCMDAGIMFPKKYATFIEEARERDLPLGQVRSYETYIMDMLTYQGNVGLFDAEERTMEKSLWDTFGYPKNIVTAHVEKNMPGSEKAAPSVNESAFRDDKSDTPFKALADSAYRALAQMSSSVRLDRVVRMAEYLIDKQKSMGAIRESQNRMYLKIREQNDATWNDMEKCAHSQKFVTETLESHWYDKEVATTQDLRFFNELMFV